MPTVVDTQQIVTTSSNHVAPGASPAVSLSPPTPPAGPIPLPYVYIAKSSTAKGTSTTLKINGGQALKAKSYMDIELPGNTPSTPIGSFDIITMAKCKEGHPLPPLKSQAKVESGSQPVAVTLDKCVLNVMTEDMQLCQSIGPFMGMADFLAKAAKGFNTNDIKVLTVAEPVAVATGDVVDEAIDVDLGGLIPVSWVRTYSTGRSLEISPLGPGGWTHSLDQWIRPHEDGLILREASGNGIPLPELGSRASFFHRGSRQTVTAGAPGCYAVYSHATELTRDFGPVQGGETGVAMLRSIRDAYGHEVVFHYDHGLLSRVVDTAKRELRIVRGPSRAITAVEVRARGTLYGSVQYEYDDAGQLCAARDLLGHVERYAYDGHRRMVEKTRKNGVRFHYAYDLETGRCNKAWGDGKLHAFELDYDLKLRTTVAHGNPQARRYEWNTRGAIVRIASFDGAAEREIVRDDDDFVLEVKCASGTVYACEYDERGNMTKYVDAAGSENVIEYAEDRRVRWTQPGGMVTEYGYDHRGALIAVTDSLGRSTRLDYDEHGRLIGVFGEGRPSFRYEHDEEHNIVKIVNAYGGVATNTFDPLGRLVSHTEPRGYTTRYEYDLLGQLVEARETDGAVSRWTYDALGKVVETRSPSGWVRTTKYSGTGVPVSFSLGEGTNWDFINDVNEELRAARNPRGEKYEFRRDRTGRITETVGFDGVVTRYQTGKNELVSRIEYEDETWREFSYDGRGDLVEERSPHATCTIGRDEFGRTVEATLAEHSGKVVARFERGVDAQLESESLNERNVKYEIDSKRRRVARILPNGETTRYGYDEAGGLAFLEHEGFRVSFERDKAGLEVRRRFHRSGVQILTAHDHRQRAVRRTVVDRNGVELIDRRFEYDPADRLTAMHDSRHGSFTYSHDQFGRIVGARGPGLDESYEHDATGSVVGVHAGGAREPWTIGRGGKVVRTPFAEYHYDSRGRRTRRVGLKNWKPDGTATRYAWDCRDQLREVELPGGTRVLFTYDAFGRRVRKEIIPPMPDPLTLPQVRVVEYVWEQDTLAMEIDSERGTRVYVLGAAVHEPILQSSGGRVDVFVNDQMRSPVDVIAPDGTIAWSAPRSPWGRVLGAAAAPMPFRMLGQYEDEETGLRYVRFRYFDPEIAAWISPDPVGVQGGWNLHAFNGNPTCHADILGLVPCGGWGNIKYKVENGRITGMQAIVTRDMIVANSNRSWLKDGNKVGTDADGRDLQGSVSGDARGHIIANQMGGPGTGPMADYNLTPLRQNGCNAGSGGMSTYENQVAQAALTNGPVTYNVNLNGGGPDANPGGATDISTRPTGVGLSATDNSGNPVFPPPTINNP